MKKLIAFVLALVCILALCSCGRNSQKAVATVFSQSVTKVDVTHRIGTETRSWSIEGTEIDLLREWFNNLDYRLIEVKDGRSPGDSNGNEVYTFAFTGGEWLGFSYIINGENDCYLLDTELNPEGNWFSVSNPSIPPLYFDSGASIGAQFPHFIARIVEIHNAYILVEPETGAEELKSGDKFGISLEDVDNPAELKIGDSVLVVYDGKILETYPATLGEVYSVGKFVEIRLDNSQKAN